jgi:hypothetical protein
MTRPNSVCPYCRQHTAIFFAASSKAGVSWYHCVRVNPIKRGDGRRAPACSRYFEAPSPVPLRAPARIAYEEAA